MTSAAEMTPRVRVIRAVTVAGLAGLSVVRLVLVLEALQTGASTSLVSEVLYLAPFLLALGGCLLAFGRARGTERRFWASLAVAAGTWMVGEIYYSYYVLRIDPQGPALPAPFQLFEAAALAALLVMICTSARFKSPGIVVRLRFFTAALAGLVAVYIFSYHFLVQPLFAGTSRGGLADAAIGALYPVVALALLAGTFGIVFGLAPSTWRPWQKIAATGMSLIAFGLASMPFWVQSRLADSGPPPMAAITELGLGLGPYLFFMAAVYRVTSTDDSDALALRPFVDDPPPWMHVLYPIGLALAVPLVAGHALTFHSAPTGTVMLAADVLLAGLLLTRSWLSSVEVLESRRRSDLDDVTGLRDERALTKDLRADIAEADRWGGDVALGVLDIDDLTRVNELYGHQAGDDVLRSVARVLQEQCGDRCGLYRVGSDEFVVVAPGESLDSAADLCRKIARLIERDVVCSEFPITVSAGVTSHGRSGESAAMISEAFSALQTAKILNRGSVVVYDPDIVRAQPSDERFELARKEAYLATVRALAAAVDARDPASRNHSRNVAALTRELAIELGIDPERIPAIETAALVHDIGKLALPDELLWKRGELDRNEQAKLREHVELGEHILRSTDLGFILPWVRAHHERWDGAGYPDGLAGDLIPFEARILAVCDAYDAMTSGLPGFSGLTQEEALAEVRASAGSQFDPVVSAAFVRLKSRTSGAAEVPPASDAAEE